MSFFNKKMKQTGQAAPGVHLSTTSEVGDEMPQHPDAPWVLAALHHDDRFLRMAAQVKNWRQFALFGLVLAACSIGGVIYIGSQSKIVPYMIEVDKLGRTLAVRAIGGKDAVNDPKKLTFREMIEFFENCRMVTADAAANNMFLTRAFDRLSESAYGYVKRELLLRGKPNDIAVNRTISVDVKSAIPVSDNLWTVEWIETSYNLKGEPLPHPELWKANVHFELRPGGKDDLPHNPTGFTITSLSWAKQM
ncbi:VirB8/TrbF family protein [Glaciimonas sp. GG7]